MLVIMFYSILGVLLLLVLYLIFTYNRMVSLKARVDETWRQIDVRLQNRYDLLPDLIHAVEKAVSTDERIQTKIAELRSAVYRCKNMASQDVSDIGERIKGESFLENAIRNLQVSVESYPELRSQESIKNFMDQNGLIEEKIAAARQIYNVTAREYNEYILFFPNNLVSGVFGFRPAVYFESSERARSDIKPTWGGSFTQDK